MKVLLAYDNSRNANIALEAVKSLLGPMSPVITLISVVEDVGSSTAGARLFYFCIWRRAALISLRTMSFQ